MTEPSATSLGAAARIAHHLGLAACFGGTLFGKAFFNSSLPVIRPKSERGRLGAAFWNGANPINAAAFGLAVATWLPYRSALSRRMADRRMGGLLLAKDVLMGAAASAGSAAVVAQIVLNRRAPEGAVPLESGGVPAPEADDTTALVQRAVGSLGGVNAAIFAGLVAVTAVLSEASDGRAGTFRVARHSARRTGGRVEIP